MVDYDIVNHLPRSPIVAIPCWLIDVFPVKQGVGNDQFVHSAQLEESDPNLIQ